MPACRGLGRLIACDLIGMATLTRCPIPVRSLHVRRAADFSLPFGRTQTGNDVIFVLHELGLRARFDWANQHRDRVQDSPYGSYRHAHAWSEFPERARATFRAFRSPDATIWSADNVFVERLLRRMVMRQLSKRRNGALSQPFANPGEDRRPTLTWPRQIPLDGEPAEVVKIVSEYSQWLAHSQVPKLYSIPSLALSTMAVNASFAAHGPIKRKSQ